MLKSIWRYSHLVLAVSSCLMLTLLSITGIFLAFDPAVEQRNGYKIADKDAIAINTVVPALKEKFPTIQSINVDEYGRVVMNHINAEDATEEVYIDPQTATVLGKVEERSPLMEWMTNLHRSLFLKDVGRAIAGITAVLLILITISGILLLIQRQKGLLRFFAPAGDKGSAQYYHVVFGRITLFLILFIALTGGYLSYHNFFPNTPNAGIEVEIDNIQETPEAALVDFEAWKGITLDQVEKIQYPFSEFPEDYYQLDLKDKKIAINQFTGETLATENIAPQQQLQKWAMDWHTGRGSILWALIMGIGAGYILFFIVSGFIITFKRIRRNTKNTIQPSAATHVILVGSENGTTRRYADSVFAQLKSQQQKVYIATLNEWQLFENIEHLIVLTATYGDGEAPATAHKFLEKLQAMPQHKAISYSVVGFGSRQYAQFCGFAYQVHESLAATTWASPILPVYTIDDKSPSDFDIWMQAWSKVQSLSLSLDPQLTKMPKRKMLSLEVVAKTALDENEAFVLTLNGNIGKVKSGDLLSIFPANDYRERLYSIGKVNGMIQLCIKQQYGLGSSYLFNLNVGQQLNASIVKNEHFHLPKSQAPIVMICNGTGIAPFLGMIDENMQTPISLYCGFRTENAFSSYRSGLEQAQNQGKLQELRLALSRETVKTYVSDLIVVDSLRIAAVLKNKGTIMICGSLSMMKDVMKVLENIGEEHQIDIDLCKASGQILTDCY